MIIKTLSQKILAMKTENSAVGFNFKVFVWVWIRVSKPMFSFSDFFFSSAWTVRSHELIVWGTKNTIHGSHGIIHSFKNYFATVFSISTKINCIQTDFLLLKKSTYRFHKQYTRPTIFRSNTKMLEKRAFQTHKKTLNLDTRIKERWEKSKEEK